MTKRPTIARIWRGRTRPEHADEYEAYNYEAGIKQLPSHVQILQIRSGHGLTGPGEFVAGFR